MKHKLNVLFKCLLTILFAQTLLFFSYVTWADKKDHAQHVHHELKGEEHISSESVYNLTAQWTNQGGKSFNLSSLKGHPVVVAMIYTSCQSACSVIVSKMKDIDEKLMPMSRTDTRFLLISFDPERDTVEKLKSYSEIRKLDLSRWTLLHGDAASIRATGKILGVKYKKDAKGDFDHSNIITVLDREGVIKFQQIGLSSEIAETIKKVEKISAAPATRSP